MPHEKKYHHLIPKTYLKAWCYKNESIYVIDKKTNKIDTKNIDNNFGRSDFHTIKAGMPICENKDLEKIFKVLEGYEVYCDNKKLENLEDYNKRYYEFNKWVIIKDGNVVSKKIKNVLKNEIENVKIMDIENLWAQRYEDKWGWLRNTIEYKICRIKLKEIDEFYKGLIMRFVILYNWRGFNGNDVFNEICEWLSKIIGLERIDIPKEDRAKLYIETASEEIKHFYLLKEYREFLKDEGKMYDLAKKYIKFLNIKFYIASGNKKFITSDSPSFVGKDLDGNLAHVMPVTPEILICVSAYKANKRYLIERINENEVISFNKQIFENSFERIITKIKDFY
ncbi:MAG: DUF4238 domain-containing protein [Caloramator sp.]|nr:DUF4238 domain-containing protein [Caloramator sp.]